MIYLLGILFFVSNLFAVIPDDNPINCLPFNSDGTINYECVEIAPLPFTQYTILSGNFPNLYPYVSFETTQIINEDNTNNISYIILFVNDVNVSITSNPSHGIVEKTATQIIYTPSQDYNGIDSFTINFSDDTKGVLEKTVTITIDAVNDIPEITMSNEMVLNAGSSISKIFTMFDAEGDTITTSISTAPTNGIAEVNGTMIEYTPYDYFFGTDTFTLSFDDGNGGVATKDISVIVHNVKRLEKGWNLTSLPTSSSLYMPEAIIVWNYDTQTQAWKSYSNSLNNQLIDAEVSLLEETSTAKAYWVYSSSDINVSFENTTVENFTYYDLVDGWHMLGSYDGIDDFSIYSKDSRIAWMYNDGVWTAKGFYAKISSTLSNLGYEELTKIPPKSGFWLYKEVNIAPKVDFSIYPNKTEYYLNEDIGFTSIVSDDNDFTLKWTWLSSTAFTPSITTLFKQAGTYYITLKAIDDRDESNITTKSITVIDKVKEPDLSTLTPKKYTFENYGVSTTIDISKASSDTLNMNVISSGYSNDLEKPIVGNASYVLSWTGKGYEGVWEKNDWVFLSEYINNVYVTATFEKSRKMMFVDFQNKTIKYKFYGLVKVVVNTAPIEYVYLRVDKDGAKEYSEGTYNLILQNFESHYSNAEIVEDTSISISVKDQILTDLGYEIK